jgi:uncharacterized protein
MKLPSLFFVSLFAIASAISSAQPSNEAKQLAQEVLDLTASESLIQGVRQSMTPMFQQMQKQFGSEKLNAKQQEIMQRFMAEFMDDMMGPEYMGKIKTSMLDAYATIYSVDELRGIRDFYRSPAGIAFVQKAPQVMSQSMPMMQSLLPPMMERIKGRAAKMADEMKAAQ